MKATVDFSWAGVTYAKGDTLPAMSVTQARHVRARGYGQNNSTLLVGKPFTLGVTAHAAGGACPSSLSDVVTRRLVAGRFLV